MVKDPLAAVIIVVIGPRSRQKEKYRVVAIKQTGILKKVRKDIGAWKGAVVVILVVGVVVVVEDRDPLTTLIIGHTGQSGRQRINPESSQ